MCPSTCTSPQDESKENSPFETKNRATSSEPLASSEIVWNITAHSIRPVPRFYPVEKSSIRLRGIAAETLAQRISNYFRENSIAAKYDNDNASVEANTHNHITFTVNFWKGEDSAASNGVIILEARRISGCSVDFHALCRALFDVARAEDMYPLKTSHQNDFDIMGSVSNIVMDSGTSYKRSSAEEANDALSIALSMMENINVDSKILGLEYLCSLTNPKKVLREDASHVSHSLLFGLGAYGATLRGHVVSNITAKIVDIDKNVTLEEDDLLDYCCLIEKNRTMHNLALQALANAFRVTSSEGKCASEFGDLAAFWFQVISALIVDLDQVANRPHDAALAAVCLCHLIQHSTGETRKTLEQRILLSVKQSYQFGKKRHESLAVESLKLLEMINQDAVKFTDDVDDRHEGAENAMP